MSGTLAILRRELGAMLDSPVAWVMAGLFFAVLHTGFFFLGYPIGDLRLPAFWSGSVASLDTLFAWIPPLLCIVIPAITMGGWAEEARSGTDELLLTQPLRTVQIVLGKGLAAWLLLCLVLLCAVVPVALVVGSLGPLDWGSTVGGLLGAWLLALACVAVGLCASAWTHEPFVAFGASASVLTTLWAAGTFVRLLPASLAEVAWYASPSLHFQESGARGLLDLRDVVYFVGIAAVFLFLNVLAVERRRWRS